MLCYKMLFIKYFAYTKQSQKKKYNKKIYSY